MMRSGVLAVALAVILGAAPGGSSALADPAPLLPLQLTHQPTPRHLRMRTRIAAVPPPPARPATPMPAAPPTLAQVDLGDRSDELAALRDVREPVSFSLTIGYQVDGARPTGRESLDGPVQVGRDFNALRSYGFGELFFSTRGVALDSLSSYFALRLDAAQRSTTRVPEQPGAVRIAPPIATWFERNTFEVRTGWGEVKDFLPRRLGLQKLRLRAGSQYVYGPWVLHIDGALLAYDGDIATVNAYAGGRHADYTELADDRYAVAGASVRVDLRRLVALPVAIAGETLSVQSFVAGQPDSAHRQLEIDWQPRRDLTVFGQLRTLDDRIANQRVQLRVRYREVTNLVVDVMRRFDTDWRWDPSLIAADDPTAARRYLDLGPVLPQVIASLRGGTLIAENVDLLARTTVAADLSEDGAPTSSFSANYFEAGGALELRLRRQIAVGASVLSRQTQRDDAENGSVIDVADSPQPLAASAATGETGFTEIGGRVRMTLGARRFSAMVEVYGRRTTYAESYRDPADPIDVRATHGGGRASVDAWIGKRLRLFASYDLSSAIEFAPAITGYKSLRLTMTGVY